MQIEVHTAEPRDVGDELHAAQCLEAEMPLLIAIQVSAALEIFVGGEQEAARAARRVHDDLAGPRLHTIHHRLDDRPRREVLPRSPLDVLGVLLQQPLVGVTLHVGGHRRPVLPADQGGQQPSQRVPASTMSFRNNAGS